jgi:hypothetical protein
MNKMPSTNRDKERAEPLGDTGHGDTGVPAGEPGISNRAGDADPEEFEDELDEVEEEEDEEGGGM